MNQFFEFEKKSTDGIRTRAPIKRLSASQEKVPVAPSDIASEKNVVVFSHTPSSYKKEIMSAPERSASSSRELSPSGEAEHHSILDSREQNTNSSYLRSRFPGGRGESSKKTLQEWIGEKEDDDDIPEVNPVRELTRGIEPRASSGPFDPAVSHEVFSHGVKNVPEPPSGVKGEIIGEEGHDQQPVFPDIVLREEIPNRTQHASRKWLRVGIGVGVVFSIALIIIVSTVLVSITVKVKPKQEHIVLENMAMALDVAETALNVSQKVIPAERFEFTRTLKKEFSATGLATLEERARGSVKIYNNFSSSAQRLVQGTRFVGNSGILYRLAKTVVVPGAQIDQGKIVPQFMEAELQADKPGEESNLAAGETRLRIPGFEGTSKYEGFYAIASAGFSGGFVGEAKVVTREDLVRAEEQASKEIFDAMREEISRKIPPDFTFAEGLREIQIIEMKAPQEKTRGAIFSVEVHARGRVLVFRERDVFDVLKQVILQGDTTKTFVADSLHAQYQVRNFDLEKGVADLLINGDVAARYVIAKEAILDTVRGKEEETILNTLRKRPDVASFSVAFFPPWITRVPENSKKIHLVVEGE